MTRLIAALPYLVGLFAVITAIILFSGLFSMAGEESSATGNSNVLMRWRVGMQAATLALLGLHFLLTSAV